MTARVKDWLKKDLMGGAAYAAYGYCLFLAQVFVCRFRYRRTLCRLRKAWPARPIRVLFIVSETSKWKAQSLYEELDRSSHFEPLIGLMRQLDTKEYCSDRNFFERLGDACCAVYDRNGTEDAIVFAEFRPDVVFYPEPWIIQHQLSVWNVSRFALTCYIPYSIEGFASERRNRQRSFHQLMFANFAWSRSFANYYRSLDPWYERAGVVCGTGHTSLDPYYHERERKRGDFVIYAPHFSFAYGGHDVLLHQATFDWSGRAMLAYAKSHPEIKWVFKPHPRLRSQLVDVGFMSAEEVDDYYAEWESVGSACYDGDYSKRFLDSYAMITDCGSFLMEYSATGSPLIRLVPADLDVSPSPMAKELFETFYQVKTLPELYEVLDLVVLRREDPRQGARLAATENAQLTGNFAARRILETLTGFLTEKM